MFKMWKNSHPAASSIKKELQICGCLQVITRNHRF